MCSQHVHIVNRSMILLFTLSLHHCWNIFKRLGSLGYRLYNLYITFFDFNLFLGPHAPNVPAGVPSPSWPWFTNRTFNDRSISNTHNPIRNTSSRRHQPNDNGNVNHSQLFFLKLLTKPPFNLVARHLRANPTNYFPSSSFDPNHLALPSPTSNTYSQYHHPLSATLNFNCGPPPITKPT